MSSLSGVAKPAEPQVWFRPELEAIGFLGGTMEVRKMKLVKA